jgi:hypothetical protein
MGNQLYVCLHQKWIELAAWHGHGLTAVKKHLFTQQHINVIEFYKLCSAEGHRRAAFIELV